MEVVRGKERGEQKGTKVARENSTSTIAIHVYYIHKNVNNVGTARMEFVS